MFDSELLRSAILVAERRSFSHAALARGCSQSTISGHIRRLEDAVGRTLFDRSSHHVTLTAYGETFLTYARRILELGADALRALEQSDPLPVLRIGCVEDWMSRRLPAALSLFKAQNPHVVITLSTGSTVELMARLGIDIDLAIGLSDDGARGPGICVQQDQLIWATSAAAPAETAWDPLPLALHPPGCLYRRAALQALDDHGLKWFPAVTSPGLSALEAVVSEGLAVAPLLRSTLPDGLKEVTHMSLPPLPKFDIVATLTNAAPLAARRFFAALEKRSADAAPR